MSIHDTVDLFGEICRPQVDGILKRRFLLPPFSVLSARDGDWQERKRMWLSLGIQSELGRGDQPKSSPVPVEGGLADGLTALRTAQKAAHMTSGSSRAMELAGGFKPRHGAAPGGALMPAADYSKRQRGNGKGEPIG